MGKRWKRDAARAAPLTPTLSPQERGEGEQAAEQATEQAPAQAGIAPEHAAIVRRVLLQFAAAIPGEVQSRGHCTTPHIRERHDIPDGDYRVAGADWILRFKDGALAEAFRAAPPLYGGPDVVAVPN